MSSFNPEQHLSDIDHKIVAALAKVSEIFRVLLWAEAKEHNISPIQMQLLIFLKYHAADKLRTVVSMAREFNVTKATISDSLKALLQKGLVVRVQSETDSRSFLFSLTGEGQQLTNITEHFTQPLQSIVADLTAEQKEYLLRSVLQLIYALNTKGIIAVQRMCYSCTHYQGNRSEQHYCTLLEVTLALNDLRIDCALHKPGLKR